MNKDEVTVLLNGWGGFAGTSIIDCLKNNYEKRKIRVVCTDIQEKPILRYKADSFHILPKGNSKTYLNSLFRLCKNEKISIIMPGSGSEIITISKNIEKLTSKNIIPIISNFNTIKKLMSKVEVYKILDKNNIPIPKFYHVKNYDDFKKNLTNLGYPKKPVCFKPSSYKSSGGARGFRILKKNNSLQKIILESKPGSPEIDYDSCKKLFSSDKKLDLMMMEYLPGTEISAYVFADKGKMLYCIPNKRERLEQFYSFEASTQKIPKINELCKKIIDIFQLDYNVNIQFKKDLMGHFKVIEINPRMGGSIILPAAAGLNLPYFAIKQALGEKLPEKKLFHNTRMIRYWKEFFLSGKNKFEYL